VPGYPIHLVVIGDSIPRADMCPQCTGFVALYAKHLETALARPVIVQNHARNDSAGMMQIKRQLADDAALRDEIAAGEIVLVSVGYNNVFPDPATGVGCSGDAGTTDASAVAWALQTKADCLAAGIKTWAAVYDDIFSTIVSLRPDKPTMRIALNAYNGNIDWIRHADVPKDVKPAMERWLVAAYDRWNPMECDRASAAGFTCVDIYHAFSGPNGNDSIAALTIDGTHPNQAGSDLIAGMLAKLDTSAIAK